MSDLTPEMIMNIVVLLALFVTIVYAIRLSRQLSQVRGDQERLRKLIADLEKASDRAENAVKSMRETAEGSGDDLQDRINAARSLTDELEIMIEAGDSLAGRLELAAESSRKSTTSGKKAVSRSGPRPKTVEKPVAKKPEPVAEEDDGKRRSRAERQLLAAVRAKEKQEG